MSHSTDIYIFHDVIYILINLLNIIPEWIDKFERALQSVKQYNLEEFSSINSLNDWLLWCNNLLYWIPTETESSDNVDNKLVIFHFFFNQPSLSVLQERPLLSQWMVEYAKAYGTFLNSTDSLTKESLQTFYRASKYRMNEYLPSPSGWQTFNQLFARYVKPGKRPIDYLGDDRIIVSVADSVYKGSWKINRHSEIQVKGITWSIEELLADNPYSDHFQNGLFMHAYLSPTDYHRLHTPLSGKVLYTKVVPGHVYLETFIYQNKLNIRRPNYKIKSKDNVGFQFSQARGILILETPLGIVAILPIGMSLVSSVVMTAEVGAILHKGQEFAYFQFGASDYIVLFPSSMGITMTAEIGIHYDQGKQIGII